MSVTAVRPGEPVDREALLARVDFFALVRQRVELTGEGGERRGACPFPGCPSHGTAHKSFAVNADKRLFVCYRCGATGSPIDYIMRLEGLSFRDACQQLANGPLATSPAPHTPAARLTSAPPYGKRTPALRHRTFGPPATLYRYRDAVGQELGAVARYEFVKDGKRGKSFLPITWGSEDGGKTWDWKCGAWNLPRPLYGLDHLATRPKAPVLVVEGEKAADAARRLLPAFVTVTWPGGSKAVSCIDWTPLTGRDVTLWPDADAPGIRAMDELRALLEGMATRVRWLDVSGQPETWDVADAVAEGWTRARVVTWARGRVRCAGDVTGARP